MGLIVLATMIENVVLGAVTVALFYGGHATAGGWCLAGLITNICSTSYRTGTPNKARIRVPEVSQTQTTPKGVVVSADNV